MTTHHLDAARLPRPRPDPPPAVTAVPTDAQLLAGGPEQFGQLFERYAAALIGYCARRVGPDLAEDIAAATFLTAFERRHRYEASAPTARPWLYGIATNVLRNHRRAEVRGWRALARTGADPIDGARRLVEAASERIDERIDAARSVRVLAGALAAMPAGQRDVLLLHAWSGLDYAELAAALDLPAGTVRSRLHRARARLRRALPDVEEKS